MKKKTISKLLILMLLLLPFGVLLNAKAADVQIQVDSNTSKTGDSNSKLVTNQGTITVNGINYTNNTNDTLKAYKILDTFYNSTTNEISYDFTSSFKAFKTSLNSNDTYKNITIEQYMALTNDGYICAQWENDMCIDVYIEGPDDTTSTLNVLVSKFATYIRSNQGTANAVTAITMNNGTYEDELTATVAAGAYLVLPDSIINRIKTSEGYPELRRYIYGAMVGNVYFGLDASGDLVLNNASINAKTINNYMMTTLINDTISGFFSAMSSFESDEEMDEYFTTTIGQNINFTIGKKFSLMAGYESGLSLPANTHENITENTTVMNKLSEITVTLPAGFTFDYTSIVDGEGASLTQSGSDYYDGDVNGDKIATRVSDTVLKTYDSVMIDVVPSTNYAFTAGAVNNITVSTYVLKDPYVDIGANPTDNDIAKAIEEVSITNTATTYGVKMSNVNSNNNTLSGAQFQLCSDSTCSTLVGSPFTVQTVDNETLGEFVGISGNETAYFKQIKAPTGYRLITTPIEVDPEDLTLGQDGYYSLEVTNSPMLALPFTGGSGTVIYTVIGLLIVVGAGIFLVLYKKKNKKDN